MNRTILIIFLIIAIAVIITSSISISVIDAYWKIKETSMQLNQQRPKDIKLEVPHIPTKTHPIEVSVDGKRLGPVNALVLRAGPDNTVTNVSVEMTIATTLEFCGYLLPTLSVPEDEEIERLLSNVYSETIAGFPPLEVAGDQHLKAEFVREIIQNFCAKF